MIDSSAIGIVVNGRPVTLERPCSMFDFLIQRGLKDRLVAVELNGAMLARNTFESTMLAEGDTLEIVHFVGGG